MNKQRIALPNSLECYCFGKEETELIFQEIFTENHYFKHAIVINDGDCIFDVGANIGLFTLFVNQLHKKDVKIFAFEPIKEIFELLKENIYLNFIPNTFCFNYGFGSENQANKQFTFYPHLASNSTTRPEEKLPQREVMYQFLDKEMVDYLFQNSEQTYCEIKTLSSSIRQLGIQSIDLLKIDVEGDEYSILQGIDEDDWSKIKQIVIEINDIENRLNNIVNLLKKYDFNIIFEKNNLLPSSLNNYNLYASRH
jgi:FkbM family methyltransferase